MSRTGRDLISPVLVLGFARTGQSVARVLGARGVQVLAVDDRASDTVVAAAVELGVELFVAPSRAELGALVDQASLVVVSPGVAPSHQIFDIVAPELVVSEIELAYDLLDIPLVALTGTNGKTTVCALVAEMLVASGVRARALGNIGVPLIEAVLDDELELVVAEVSSFQLALTSDFSPKVATWLNLAEDHLDWHVDLADYATAKARIWQAQTSADIAVANADDDIVMSHTSNLRAQLVTFGASRGDYHLSGDHLIGPSGELATLGHIGRDLPHDRLNALAAFATALSAGAHVQGCLSALESWTIPPHRVDLVAEIGGVRYYDDSKATTPSAVMAALSGFSSAVLIAGGRNKGLDLSAIRRFVDEARDLELRGLVAIGESSDELVKAFSPGYRVVSAPSMHEAVVAAARCAEPGDVVLLSPGCASFDWYHSYEERGDDFKDEVRKIKARV